MTASQPGGITILQTPRNLSMFRQRLPNASNGETQSAMPVTIPDEFLEAAHLSGPEIKREIAVALFQQERLTQGQASRLAEISQQAFQRILAERRIPIHYRVEEFHQDLHTLRELGRI